MSRTVIAGRFELLSHAGQGGMGSVYRARDLASGHTVAVKVLTTARPLDLVRFRREAAVLATLSHPNVVDYVAHGEADGVHYLVQGWIDGVTLNTLLRQQGMTAREAVALALGVARALEATHALGIIHRDVKPSNLILAGDDPSGSKLVDFGVARPTIEAGVVTRTGVMVGTPAYMAPEQALGLAQIDPAADVWSLGCVLYEALTGKIAFAGKTSTAIRAKVLLGETLPLADRCREAPRELLALVDDMLRKDVAARIRDGAALVARLSALPEIDDGPRRRTGTSEPATVVMPVLKPVANAIDNAACYALVAGSDDAPIEPLTPRVSEVAARHGLAVHTFEDGAMLLEAPQPGRAGASAVAHAALELRRSDSFDGAITLFGKAYDDTFDTAVDRGSLLLEKAMIHTLFHDGDNPVGVHIDDVIAELIASELAVDSTEHGPVLRVARTS